MRKKLEHSIKAVVQDGKAISGKDAVLASMPVCLRPKPTAAAAAAAAAADLSGVLKVCTCVCCCRRCCCALLLLRPSAISAPSITCSGGAAHLRPPLPQIHGQGKQLALLNCTTVQRLGCLHACPPLPTATQFHCACQLWADAVCCWPYPAEAVTVVLPLRRCSRRRKASSRKEGQQQLTQKGSRAAHVQAAST